MENRILSEGIEIDGDNSNSGDNIGTAKADLKKDNQALTTQFMPGKEFSDSKSNVRFRVPFVLVKMDLTVDHKKNRLNSTKKSQINDGRKTEKRVQQFKCTVCGLKFQSSSVLQGHSKIHLEKRNHTRISLTRVLNETPHPEFAVPSKSLDWKLGMNVRPIVELTKLDPNQITVRVAQRKDHQVSNSRQNLQNHNLPKSTGKKQNARGRKIGKQHKCAVCEKKFKYLSNLKMHLISHSDERPHKCQACPKLFKHKRHLKFHSKIHSDERRNFECHECRKKFYTRGELTSHNRSYHDQEQFKCNTCGKKLTTKYRLNSHSWTQHGIEDNRCKRCPLCNMKIYSESSFSSHYRTHTGERPFECPMCTRRFIQNSSLNNHILTHTREKPHICQICRKSYMLQDSLKAHLRIHNKEQPYPCRFCKMRFQSISSLNRHIHRSRHTKEKCFCETCSAEFVSSSSLKSHKLKLKH